MTVHWIEGVADRSVDIGARLATDVRLDDVKNDPRITKAAAEEMERLKIKI